MPKEEWKPIKRLPHYGTIPGYMVSNRGRVKSFKRSEKGTLLKERLDNGGYPRVWLSRGNESFWIPVHRLVANAFVPKRGHQEVNHKDGRKTNNKHTNLEWCSRRHNVRHAVANQLKLGLRGSDNPRSKLTEEKVAKIIATLHKTTWPYWKVARKHNVSVSAVKRVAYRRSWTHVPVPKGFDPTSVPSRQPGKFEWTPEIRAKVGAASKGRKHSKSTRAKMRDSQRARRQKEARLGKPGSVWSPEAREAARQRALGNKHRAKAAERRSQRKK